MKYVINEKYTHKKYGEGFIKSVTRDKVYVDFNGIVKKFSKKKPVIKKANTSEKGIIYFIYNQKDEVIYVGKTKNINSRLSAHKLHTKYWNDSFYNYKFKDEIVSKINYIEVDNSLSLMEIRFIQHFSPKFNIVHNKNQLLIDDIDKYDFKKYDLDENSTINIVENVEYILNHKEEIFEIIYMLKNYYEDNFDEYLSYSMSRKYNLVDILYEFIEDPNRINIKEIEDIRKQLCCLVKYKLIKLEEIGNKKISINIIPYEKAKLHYIKVS